MCNNEATKQRHVNPSSTVLKWRLAKKSSTTQQLFVKLNIVKEIEAEWNHK